MLSSSLDSMLTLYKKTSVQKLFRYDCVTLYIFIHWRKETETRNTTRLDIVRCPKGVNARLPGVHLSDAICIICPKGLYHFPEANCVTCPKEWKNLSFSRRDCLRFPSIRSPPQKKNALSYLVSGMGCPIPPLPLPKDLMIFKWRVIFFCFKKF